METRYFKEYSHCLSRDMEFKVYGHHGFPILYIPCQGGRFFDFESFHMDSTLAPYIDEGKVMVFSCDTIDNETWADKGGDPRYRIEQHERWIHYIVDELVPRIHDLAGERNGYQSRILTFGCSMGAMHAVNLFFRWPDIFEGCLALSGLYDSYDSFGGYMDDLVYQNSITDYITNMPKDHPFIERYNRNKAVVCVGQGAWEEPWSTRYVDEKCKVLGINIWFDYWGHDVNHDWPWWYRQVPYFLPYLLDE